MINQQPINDNPLMQSFPVETEEFIPLAPKGAKKIGEVGLPEEPVLPPVLDRRSITPMDVVDVEGLANEEEE